MKKVFFLLLLVPVLGFSQKKHTVGAKETLFSIGRLYNVHPRELAEYNNILYGTGLSIGQVLKIPSKTTLPPLPPVNATDKPIVETKTPPVKAVKKDIAVTLVPVYHKVQKKENLFQISRLYNKVPIDDLRKWNNLSAADALKEGMNLIVGYSSSDNATPKTIIAEPNIDKVNKTEPVVEKKTEPIVEKKVEPIIEKTQPVKPIKEPEVVITPVTNGGDINFNGGVFKTLFGSQTKNNEILQEEGAAGVFKSTSGWEDGKYYCLHNTAAAGTIIKITNTTSGRSIYAKVLDVIQDIKLNAGLMIRVSNAAAAELQAGESNFNCTLNYSK